MAGNVNKKYEIDMCNGPLLGKILVFYVPLMLSGVLQLLFNAADIAVLVGTDKGEDGRANKSIRAIAADEINTLIKAADPEGGKTIENINNLIAYVDENAGEIASLITATDANTAKLAGIDETVVKTIDAKIAAIPAYELPTATAEKLGGIKTSTADNGVSVNEDGVATVAKVNVNTLVQTSGDILVLNGGSASV